MKNFRYLMLIIVAFFIIGCGDGGTKNAEPADDESLDRNNIEQHLPENNSN